MPSKKDRSAIATILDNGMLAQVFVAGMTFQRFDEDRKTFYAATRCLEIISEAARRLDEDTRARWPHLEWRQIMDAGNAYRHEYDHVLETLVWDTVHDRLPELIQAMRQEAARE